MSHPIPLSPIPAPHLPGPNAPRPTGAIRPRTATRTRPAAIGLHVATGTGCMPATSSIMLSPLSPFSFSTFPVQIPRLQRTSFQQQQPPFPLAGQSSAGSELFQDFNFEHALSFAPDDWSSPALSFAEFAAGVREDRHGIVGREAKRVRIMSQSPEDRDPAGLPDVKPFRRDSAEVTTPTSDSRANPKKRPNTGGDSVDYPRRRATIACEICRSRKSRCDGTRPRCRLCTELNAECVYREPGVKLDAGDKLILERLANIEELLRAGSHSIGSGLGITSPSPGASSGTLQDEAAPRLALSRTNIHIQSNGYSNWPSSQSQMPKNHTTPALNLLRWPKIRDLISQRWDPQVLANLEMNREPVPLNVPRAPVDISLPAINQYVRAFFDHVNVWYACVSPFEWHATYRRALSTAFREGPDSCLVFFVIALGCASSHNSISNFPPGTEPPGFGYFASGWNLLPSVMSRNDISSAQCQILAAAYFFYMVRPLEAWNLLASTSMKLQLLFSGPPMKPKVKQLAERVYWNTLLFESDLLAELDLPHSNIENLEDLVGMPGGFEDERTEDPVGRDDLFYFHAEIALRKLLNRVSNLIYPKTAPITSTIALDPVVAELDLQLSEWYNQLPEPVKFDHGRSPPSTAVQTVLRLRYFACRTIIFRPYVLAVLIKESAFMDPNVQEHCRKCLEACIRQLEFITAHHAGHLPYLWQGALSIMSQTLLVMGATMCPSLSNLLPPPHQTNSIIEGVVQEIQRYSHLAPSLSLSAEIIKEAEDRRRMLLRSPSMVCMKIAGV